MLGLGRLELYLHHDRPLNEAEVDAFREHLRRRGRGEPVAYLVGTTGFRSLVLATDPRALVPRPETEGLVELALARLPAGGALLDLGTGSGAIALAVAASGRTPRSPRATSTTVRWSWRRRTPSGSACGRGSSAPTSTTASRMASATT